MPADSVHAQRQDNGLICIRNHRYDADGFDLGGTLVLDSASISWLADAIQGFLADRQPRSQSFDDDDLRVKFSGPDYNPLLAIFNRRRPEALQGGVGAQAMQLELAAGLVEQLQRLAPR